MFHDHLDCFFKTTTWGRPNTKPWERGTMNATNCWFILFYHAWGPAWINSIWLRARSHMTARYTWESVTTLHGFGGVLGRPSDPFFWALPFYKLSLVTKNWGIPPPPLPNHPKKSTKTRVPQQLRVVQWVSRQDRDAGIWILGLEYSTSINLNFCLDPSSLL